MRGGGGGGGGGGNQSPLIDIQIILFHELKFFVRLKDGAIAFREDWLF